MSLIVRQLTRKIKRTRLLLSIIAIQSNICGINEMMMVLILELLVFTTLILLVFFWLYIFAITEQNMSQFDLCGGTRNRLPDLPKLGQSLLLIETQKHYPYNSAGNLDINPNSHPPEDLELSLQLKMEKHPPQGISSATTIKKKKGGCTCKKTKCLKMYCECFSNGKLCGDDCNCKGCSNSQEHIQSITRAQELLKSKGSDSRVGEKGCNCKKSQCQKKYCECFNSGVACTKDCRCLNCSNCAQPQLGISQGRLPSIGEAFLN